jgi:type IV pilus assembly protein PilV
MSYIRKPRCDKGFTLLEVLISVFILGTGMLGIINLQTRALKDNLDAYLYSQATFLAYDMADRIRSNGEAWETADLSNFTPAYHFCSTLDPDTISVGAVPSMPQNCTEEVMAKYDAYRWKADVADILPNGTVSLSRVDDPITAAVDANEVVRVQISWDRANTQVTANSPTYLLDVRL